MPLANTPRKLALAIVLANLVGCAALPSSNSIGDTPMVISGELTSRSPTNVNDGSRYQIFPLQLTAGEAIEVSMKSPLGTKIALLDDQQRLINGPGNDRLTLVPEQTGRHYLNVSGDSANRYGPFDLNLVRINARNSGPISSGERIAGLLKSTAGNQYQLSVAEAAIYRISLSSDSLDTVLLLEGEGLKLENDDAEDGTNSRLDAYLKPGQYTLTAKALDENPNSTYLIAVEQRPTPQGVELTNGGRLEAGKTITGIGGNPPVGYSLRIEEPTLVALTLRSNDMDAQLNLTGNGVELSDDDGAGEGTNSRISAILERGNYRVDAGSINSQSGLFTLEYNTQAVSTGNFNRLQPGQYANSSLRNNNGAQGVLHISRAGTYQIDAYSNDFDTLLKIQGSDVNAEDDDSGGSLNSRLTLDLEPGDYQLTVKSVNNSAQGRFRVSAIAVD